jgi:hypothetical protein
LQAIAARRRSTAAGVAVVAGGIAAASIQRRYNRARANMTADEPIVRPLSPDLTAFAPSVIDNRAESDVEGAGQTPVG